MTAEKIKEMFKDIQVRKIKRSIVDCGIYVQNLSGQRRAEVIKSMAYFDDWTIKKIHSWAADKIEPQEEDDVDIFGDPDDEDEDDLFG